MTTERYFADADAEDLRDAAYACRVVAEVGGEDTDRDTPAAAQARQLTKDLGWSWDFESWGHAASILEREAELADLEEPT
jgi:hypothetical protein